MEYTASSRALPHARTHPVDLPPLPDRQPLSYDFAMGDYRPLHMLWPALLLLAWGATPASAERKWRLKENCRVLENESNDGDSFHVKWNTQKYIFRLLFVDCPETDQRIPL